MTIETRGPPEGAWDQGRSRRRLIGLALLFFAPLALAFYLYYGPRSWHPRSSVNHGELIEPPIPLPAPSLQRLAGQVPAAPINPDFLLRKWTLLTMQRGLCGVACSRQLYETRQVRLALDREMTRVQRVFLAEPDCCDMDELRQAHPDLIVLSADSAAALLQLFPHGGVPGTRNSPGPVYLIDPLANLMMMYPPDGKPKGMLEDLKRLLHLSSIG